tara:strand:- start:2108 stop:2851 length:744 start_codon:yes stop_codon:yes gene_type:complete
MNNKSSFFIIGKHAVTEALKNKKRKVQKVFLTEESKKIIHRENSKFNLLKDIKVHFKTRKELDKYRGKDQISHQGFVAEIEHLEYPTLKEFIKDKSNLNLVCLNEVNDPRNIGSIIRSAAAFNIDGIIVKERHYPSESKILYKSASGCVEFINIFKVSNVNSTLKNLKEKNFWVYAFEASGSEDLKNINLSKKNILLFGSEGKGIKKHTSKYADFTIKINMNKKVESLNISNTAAIIFNLINQEKIK